MGLLSPIKASLSHSLNKSRPLQLLPVVNLWSSRPNKYSLRSYRLLNRKISLGLSQLLQFRVLTRRSNNKIKKKKRLNPKLKLNNILYQKLRKLKLMILFLFMRKKIPTKLKKLMLWKLMLIPKYRIRIKKRRSKYKLKLNTSLKLLSVLFLVKRLFSKNLKLLNVQFSTKS